MQAIGRWLLWAAFAAWLCTTVPPLAAQSANGRVTGRVLDAQGAAIPGAAVTVTNIGTRVQSHTASGADGTYLVLNLPIGNYTVTVTTPGFARAVTPPQPLQINETLRTDIHLAVGAVSQEVTVQANAVRIQTTSPTVGGTVTGAPIQALPLNGRQTLSLAMVEPGVVPAPPSAYTAGGFTVAGGRPDSVTYLLDGGNNNSFNLNNVAFQANPDMVAEFRVLENNYTAEYGRGGGGVVSVVLKSGTNQLHGSLYDYFRNTDLDANYFFSNATGQPRAVLRRNQFGGTVGGPVIIPGVFNGKNRLFFFFGYQGQRQGTTQVGSAVTVFTPAELQGDFSHASNNGPDPKVAAFLAANPYFQPDAAQAAQAIISPASINSVAQAYIKAGVLPDSTTGTLVPNASATDNENQYTGKFDFYASPSNQLSATLGSNVEPAIYPFLPPGNTNPNVPGYPEFDTTTERFLNVSYTKIFSPTLLNVARVTANRYNVFEGPSISLPTTAALGTKMVSDDATGPANLSFASGMETGFPVNGPADTADADFTYSDTLTWTHGRNTWMGGFSFGAQDNDAYFAYEVNGGFTFSGPAGIGSGNDLADFLFGLPDSYGQSPKGVTTIRSKDYWGFLQDEWRATPSLTATAGMRYEYDAPLTDTQGRTYNFMAGVQSKRFVNAPLGLVFPGDPGAPTGQFFPNKKDFAPRLGLAWAPVGHKFSVRGGFGIYFDTVRGESVTWDNGVPPFFPEAFLFFNPPSGPITGPVPYLTDPFGSAAGGPAPNPFPSTPPPSTLNFADEGYLPFGNGGNFINPHLKAPYIYQYNLSLQRQIGAGMVLQVNYVGNSSHNLLSIADEDPMVLGTTTRVWNTLSGVAPGSFGLGRTIDNVEHGNYNGLISSLTRQTGPTPVGQMFFTISYTWSHSLDNASGWQEASSAVPFYDQNRFYGNSDFNVGQRFVLSGGWTLPGEHLSSRALRSLAGGWTLYPIFTTQSGAPVVSITAGLRTANGTNPGPSGAGDANLVLPNLVGNSVQIYDPHKTRTINGQTGLFYFNPANLTVPASWETVPYPANSSLTYGTFTRNSITGPGLTNLDLAVAKSFNVIEGLKATFRAEAFNSFNHTEFLNPSSGINSGTFGQVTTTSAPREMQLALRLDF